VDLFSRFAPRPGNGLDLLIRGNFRFSSRDGSRSLLYQVVPAMKLLVASEFENSGEEKFMTSRFGVSELFTARVRPLVDAAA